MRKFPAAELRAIVSDITGIAELGVVSKMLRDGETHYVISSRIGEFVCTASGVDWRIVRILDKKAVQVWSTNEEYAAPGEAQLLQSILSAPSTPVLKVSCLEAGTGIVRKTYDSSLGRVLIHSRRVKNGNDIVIEVTRSAAFLQLFQQLPEGAIDLGESHQLLERPF